MLLWMLGCTPEGFTVVNADGGTVEADGVTLSIPAGALEKRTEIRIVESGDPPEPYEALSPLYTFEPDGLVFAQPAQVELAYEDHALPKLFWSDADGFSEVEATFDDGIARADVAHFSSAFVAITPVETVEVPFEQRPTDILFVIDNSCSMFDMQVRLSSHDIPILYALQGYTDFHIGVVSTDMNDPINGQGRLRTVNGENHISPSTLDPLHVFDSMVTMGTNGFYDEKGRAAAYQALELDRDTPSNAGFYRQDASVDIVFVSDEEDQSGGDFVSRSEFVTWMQGLKSHPSLARAHAITQQQGNQCNPAGTVGSEYEHYANQTGGSIQDICEADWMPVIQAVVDDRIGHAIVQLPEVPSEIVSVRFEGTSDLTVDPADYTLVDGEIFFEGAVRPSPGDTIVVRYRP